MMFDEGFYAKIPVRQTYNVIQKFDIPRRRDIKRVQRVDNEYNYVILSYDTLNQSEIQEKLTLIGIDVAIESVKIPRWYPLSEKQKRECEQYWPMNDFVAEPQLPIDSVDVHEPYLGQVLKDRSVIVRSSDPRQREIISSAFYNCKDCDQCIHHGVIKALSEASKLAAKDEKKYLCTDLDVYCYGEPCVMCAMAMTHSRIGRLFYIETNKDFGGIESQVQVHCNPCLNHRYRAFRLKM